MNLYFRVVKLWLSEESMLNAFYGATGLKTQHWFSLSCYKRKPLSLQSGCLYMNVYMCSRARVFSCIFIADCFLFLSHFLSTTMPPDLPHQRIIFKLRSFVIWRRPLMCPWAFSTQPKSHRRTHTDNSTARHGFWKVTLRIASNT